MSRLNDTEALAKQPFSRGYRQKMEWDSPSNNTPDKSMSPKGSFVRATGVGPEALSGAMDELARSSKRTR